jgi:pyruvate/2-oxoglutarate dehydrogenase complex dihydrolipoamide dehydrogenase (E3) component
LIRAGRLASEAQAAAELARPPGDAPRPDFGAAMERMRAVRAQIAPHDSAQRFRDVVGVDVFRGDGRFVAGDTLAVDGAKLRFRRAILATGARASAPPIPGLADVGFLTHETVFSLTASPGRLAIVGGGPIGCELAQTFARLGVAVTIFEMGSHLLEREDADAAAIVQSALLRDGVKLVLGCKLQSIARDGAAKVLHYEAANGAGSVAVDEILVAAGRAPNVEDLGLEAAGVAYQVGRGITVDDRLRTANPRIFAVGDCCMTWKFTHAADAAAKIAVQNALFFGRKKLSALVMPWCTYTDPELAHVGLSERDAAARGIATDTFTVPLDANDRAVCDGETEGFVRVHVKQGTDQVLGATIVASHAGELLSLLTAAITHRIGLGKIGNTVFPYPTQSEAVKAVANAYTRTRLTPTVKTIFDWVLRAMR